jgi:hypothetical protein
MADLTAFSCNAGYYCLRGVSVYEPRAVQNAGNLIGDVCPKGKFCPYNLI